MDQHSEQPTGPAAGLAAGWPAARKMAAGSELAVLLATRPLSSLSDAELIDATAASHRLAGHFEAHTLAAMEELHTRREAEPRRPYDIDATQQSTAELRPVLAASAIRVQGQLRTVRSLTRDVPLLGRLVFAGRLPVWVAGKCVTEMSLLTDKAKVPIVEKRLLARLLDLAPPTKTGDHDDSDPLSEFGRALELALTDVEVVRWTPGQVLTLIRQLVAAAEPEEFDSRFRAAFRDRRTSASTDPQDNPPGMGRLTITHTGHDVETADHRLSLLARQFGADDPRSMDQRKADLAIDLLCGRIEVATSTSALEAGDEPVRIRLRDPRPGRAQVNVSVPIQTLLGVSDDSGQTLSYRSRPAWPAGSPSTPTPPGTACSPTRLGTWSSCRPGPTPRRTRCGGRSAPGTGPALSRAATGRRWPATPTTRTPPRPVGRRRTRTADAPAGRTTTCATAAGSA